MRSIENFAHFPIFQKHDEQFGKIRNGAWIITPSFILSIKARKHNINPSAIAFHLFFKSCPFPVIPWSPMYGQEYIFRGIFIVCDIDIPPIFKLNPDQFGRLVFHWLFLCELYVKYFHVVLVDLFSLCGLFEDFLLGSRVDDGGKVLFWFLICLHGKVNRWCHYRDNKLSWMDSWM